MKVVKRDQSGLPPLPKQALNHSREMRAQAHTKNRRNPDGTHVTARDMAFYFKGTLGAAGTGIDHDHIVNA